MIFTLKNDGIYYNGMRNTEVVSMLNTVEENRNHYTQKHYEHENIATELYQMVVHPYIKEYKNIIKMNSIHNFPFTIEDIGMCEKIFGPDIYTLNIKTLRTKPKAVLNDNIEITQELKDTQMFFDHYADITYIQEQMFLFTVLNTIKFINIQEITDVLIYI